MWEDDKEKDDIRSFHDAPLIASLSFHDTDVMSAGSVVVNAFPLPFFPLIGIAMDSDGRMASFRSVALRDIRNALPITLPRECDKEVGGVLKLLPVPTPVEVEDEEDEDVEGEFKLTLWGFEIEEILVGLTLGVDLLVARGSRRGFDEDRPLGTFGALVLILGAEPFKDKRAMFWPITLPLGLLPS